MARLRFLAAAAAALTAAAAALPAACREGAVVSTFVDSAVY